MTMIPDWEKTAEQEIPTDILLGIASDLETVESELGKVSESIYQEVRSVSTEPKLESFMMASKAYFERGKMLRPLAVLLGCDAVGGSRPSAFDAAIAVELAHVSSLIHDDLIDGDDLRRNVPTVHSRWGMPLAVLSGDYLLIKAYQILASAARNHGVSESQVLWALKTACRTGIFMCVGEALDVVTAKEFVTPEMYLRIIETKTGRLVQGALELGGIMGGGTEREVELLGNFGLKMGIAFQITDDVIGVSSDWEESGKTALGDIRKGRPNIVLFHAMENADADELARLRAIVGNEAAGATEIREVLSVIDKHGSLVYAKSLSRDYCEKAKKELEGLRETPARNLLAFLADLSTSRSS